MAALIHCCWFGGEKPERVLRCRKSWRRWLPGCRIVEWNEFNAGCEGSDYYRRAIKARQWAFAADYVRLRKLYEWGGVYLDMDMEVRSSLLSKWAESRSLLLLGFEKNCVQAGVMICPPRHRLIERLLSEYEVDVDVGVPGREPKSIVTRLTDLLIDEYGLRTPFGAQCLRDGIRILPANFLLVDMNDGKNLAIHHYAASWKTDFHAEAFVRDVKWYCEWAHAPIGFRFKERLKMILQYRLPWVYRRIRDWRR